MHHVRVHGIVAQQHRDDVALANAERAQTAGEAHAALRQRSRVAHDVAEMQRGAHDR